MTHADLNTFFARIATRIGLPASASSDQVVDAVRQMKTDREAFAALQTRAMHLTGAQTPVAAFEMIESFLSEQEQVAEINRTLAQSQTDAELRTAKNGKPLLKFTLIVTERILDRGAACDRKQLFRIVIRGSRAEAIAKIISAGSAVFVDGAMRSYEYRDDNGKVQHVFEVHPDHVLARQALGAMEGA